MLQNMIKQDEKDFRSMILANGGRIPYELWGTLSKRQYYLLDKWCSNGEWEFGISLRSGWLTTQYLQKDHS